MIDDLAINFFRHPLIKTSIARFHMKHGDLPSLRRNRGQTGICVSQNQHRVRLQFAKHSIGPRDHQPDRLSGISSRRLEKMIRLTNAEIVKKDLIQLVIVILASMNNRMIDMPIQCRHHARETNDLRTRTNNRRNFHVFSEQPIQDRLAGSRYPHDPDRTVRWPKTK